MAKATTEYFALFGQCKFGTFCAYLHTIETKILLEEKICNLEVGLRNVSAKFEEFTGGVTDDLFIFSEKVQSYQVFLKSLVEKLKRNKRERDRNSATLRSS